MHFIETSSWWWWNTGHFVLTSKLFLALIFLIERRANWFEGKKLMNRLSQELLPQCNKHNKRLLKDRVFYPNRFARAKIILHKLCLKVNALLGEQKLSPYQEPTPIWTLFPTPPPLPKPKLACLLFRKLQKCLRGDGREKLGFFSFFKSMLLDKRWSCCRGQSDSTNYDADFCKGNRMFQKFA